MSNSSPMSAASIFHWSYLKLSITMRNTFSPLSRIGKILFLKTSGLIIGRSSEEDAFPFFPVFPFFPAFPFLIRSIHSR